MKAPLYKESIVFFDVDDTLVSWESYLDFTIDSIEFTDPSNGHSIHLRVLKEHVEALKLHKLRDHTVIVWSAGGAEWAREIVIKLGLSDYVDAIMSKPNWFFDDLPASQFMPEINRKYLVKGKQCKNLILNIL